MMILFLMLSSIFLQKFSVLLNLISIIQKTSYWTISTLWCCCLLLMRKNITTCGVNVTTDGSIKDGKNLNEMRKTSIVFRWFKEYSVTRQRGTGVFLCFCRQFVLVWDSIMDSIILNLIADSFQRSQGSCLKSKGSKSSWCLSGKILPRGVLLLLPDSLENEQNL